jgi:serine/threonine-protein kinase
LLAAVVVGLVAVAFLQRAVSLVPRSMLPLPSLVLADRAAQILGKLGYDVGDGYRAGAFDVYEELLREVIAQDKGSDRWKILSRLRPSVIDYWFRFSPRPLVPGGMHGRVTWSDPPYLQPGMVQVRLDPAGRLRELLAVTEALTRESRVDQPEAAPAAAEPDFGLLFAAAGLPIEAFKEVTPIRVPPVFVDRRAAWIGTYPEDPTMPVRVEAGSFEGKPVTFRIIEDRYAKASVFNVEQVDVKEVEIRAIVEGYLRVAVVLGALCFAVGALRRRQADLVGARRFAVAAFTVLAAAVLVGVDYPSLGSGVGTVLFQMLAACLVIALQYWVFYVAIESRVRRVWPQMLSAWSRLLAGDVRDPLVGRSVLVGILCGLVATILAFASRCMPRLFDAPEGAPIYGLGTTIPALSGVRQTIASVLGAVGFYSLFGVTWVLLLVILKSLLGTRGRAVVASMAVYTVIVSVGHAVDSHSVWPQYVLAVATAALITGCGLRGGMLALVVGGIVFGLLESFSLVLLPWQWTTELALLTWVVLLGLAVLGTWVSIGPRHAHA